MKSDRRNPFIKQPSEEFDIDIEFDGFGALPVGADRIVSGTVEAIGWERKNPQITSDATSEILFSTNIVPAGTYFRKARFRVIGGEDDHEYKITVKVTFDNGAKLEEEVFMRVKEK